MTIEEKVEKMIAIVRACRVAIRERDDHYQKAMSRQRNLTIAQICIYIFFICWWAVVMINGN